MRRFLILALALFLLPVFAVSAEGENPYLEKELTLLYGIEDFKLPLDADFFQKKLVQVDTEGNPRGVPDDGVCYFAEGEQEEIGSIQTRWQLDQDAFAAFLEEYVRPAVDTEPQGVTISTNEEGEILFDGFALEGVSVDAEMTYALAQKALEEDVSSIAIAVRTMEPEVIVEDEALRDAGVTELVTVGVSHFTGSSRSRVHNIKTAIDTLTGLYIEPGETVSFNNSIGEVSAATNYLPELVILGDRVEKDYGGGVCQVSSTMFRAVLLSGIPVVERHPHSFAVSYYEPWGTDATIYIGGKDLRFQNDFDSPLLVQASIDEENEILRFHFYGTRDERTVRMMEPNVWGWRSPPAPRYEVSSNLAPGEVQRLSSAVSGFQASWVRVVEEPEVDPQLYEIYSSYQPRGTWVVRGATGEEPGDTESGG